MIAVLATGDQRRAVIALSVAGIALARLVLGGAPVWWRAGVVAR